MVQHFFPFPRPRAFRTTGWFTLMGMISIVLLLVPALFVTPAGAAGPGFLVKDINTSRASSPHQLVELNGSLYFLADNGSGVDLWKSNGTSSGTIRVKDVRDPTYDLTKAGNTLFFLEDSGTSFSLWRSNGTNSGTSKISAFTSREMRLMQAGGTVFFKRDGATPDASLWVSDGTSAGTTKIATLATNNIVEVFDWIDVNGVLFFTCYDDEEAGWSLWKSDGTSAGTRRISLNSLGYYPEVLANVGNTLYFRIMEGDTYALWKLDRDSMALNKMISLPAVIDQLTSFKGLLYFSVYGPVGTPEVWRTDGTSAGTVAVKNIDAAPDSSVLTGMTVVNGLLYVSANDSLHGREVWTSSGGTDSTNRLTDLNAGVANSDPAGFAYTGKGSMAIFSATNGTAGIEVWKSNGYRSGVALIQDIAPGAASSNPTEFTVAGGRVFFVADDGAHGSELWAINQSYFDTTSAPTSADLLLEAEPGSEPAVAPVPDPSEPAADPAATTGRVYLPIATR